MPTRAANPEKQVWLLTGLVAIAAVVAWSVLARWAPLPDAPFAHWPLVFGGFLLCQVYLVRFEFRGESTAITFSDVPLVIGLACVSPVALLAARLAGSTLALTVWFRQSPMKLAFNLSLHALEVAVAVCAYHLVLGGESVTSLRGWVAAVVAIVANEMVAQSLLFVVTSFFAGPPPRRVAMQALITIVFFAGATAALGVVTLSMTANDPKTLIALGALVGVFAVLTRRHLVLRERFEAVELLYGFTGAVSAALAADEALAAVLTQSAEALRAERAELTLVLDDGATWRASLFDSGIVMETRPAELLDVEREAMTSRTGAVVSAGTATETLPDGTPMRDAVVAPIDTGAVHGALLVANRVGGLLPFDDGDRRVLESLANHASVVLRSHGLLAQLRDEVAAKEHQSLHDALTGLGNRTLFGNEVAAALAAGSVVTVLHMDLDRFKDINDSLGHHFGDLVLTEVATRLVRVVDGRGVVARLGGEEFAAVVIGRDVDPMEAAAELSAALADPFLVDDLSLEVSASIGVATSSEDAADAATLLRHADIAMYQAKGTQAHTARYAPEHDAYTRRRVALVGDLRRAIEHDELELYYQPQVDLSTGNVAGVEALLRWHHPEHGFVPPDEFVGLAEHSSLIRPLTRWVLERALCQLRAWDAEAIDIDMAVNLSVHNLADPDLVTMVQELLAATGVHPPRLTLEITETSVMSDLGGSLAALNALAATGVRLSIDDFGTGYSSLSRLARLPVSEVKIDRSFVINMDSDLAAGIIAHATTTLGRNLGLRVVAEGVETPRSWQRLEEYGCHMAQGYLIARPMPADHLAGWLLQYSPPVAAVPQFAHSTRGTSLHSRSSS
jgi:diguanylate cyclase (GGDEF)-like protein